jgi:hypothetical protein
MRSLIWIEKVGDIGPEIQTTQKILFIEQIWIYYNYDHQYNFFWTTSENESCRKLRKLYRKYKNTNIRVCMWEI